MTTIAPQPPAPQAPTGLLLPGGCYIKLNNVGLPEGPEITHSHKNLCCGDDRDEWYMKYLCVWKAKYAQQRYGINGLQATEMAYGLIRGFNIKVPAWIKPTVDAWGAELQPTELKPTELFSPAYGTTIKRNTNYCHYPY